jgi:hypothetical protein
MIEQSRLRLLLAATLITSTIAQNSLPTQVSAANPLATSAATFPTCATTCLSAATNPLPCSESDSRCLCSHQADVRSAVESCLAASNACSAAEIAQAASYYERVCLALGLDQNGEPSMVIGSGSIATATDVAGIIPTSGTASTPTAGSIVSASPTASGTSSNDKEEDNNNDDGGLSVTSVAGIAAGCAFIVVAIITGLIWMYIKRRDGEEEITREVESQPKKAGFEGSASSFKTVNRSEKDTEFAMTAIPPKSSQRSHTSRDPRRKPSLAERRNKDPAHLGRTPSESMKESTYPFPFGDKRGAEASVTSLTLPSSASKPVSAMIVQKSPTRSQLSDAGSIYSVSSFNSDEGQMTQASAARRSRPTTFYNLYQNGQSTVDVTQQPAASKGQGSLRKNKFNLQVSTPTLQVPQGQHSPNPFATPPASRGQQNPFASPNAEPRQNPFDSVEEPVSPISPQQRYNPLGQNPNPNARRSDVLSAGSFGKFDFEIAQEEQTSGRRPTRSLRDSFFNSLDLGLGKPGPGAK